VATNGKAKFEKYFQGKQVETKIRSGKGPAKVYLNCQSKVSICELIEGTEVSVLPVNEYIPKYKIMYGGKIGYVPERYIAKPRKEKGATEMLGIYSAGLAASGNDAVVNFSDGLAAVKQFMCKKDIKDSVVSALKSNQNVCDEIIKNVDYIFSYLPSSFVWDASIDRFEIDELGKYIGELLFGAVVLEKGSFDGKKIVGIAVPDDPTYNGLDSFLYVEKNEIIGISSKYGTGAKASFFTNILDKICDQRYTMPDCVLKRLCLRYNPYGNAREFIYEYGVKEILGLNIDNPYKLYNAIRLGQAVPVKDDLMAVMIAIDDMILKEPNNTAAAVLTATKIRQELPYSITSFFCRKIAEQLNSCSQSLVFMMNALQNSKIYQVHLDQNRWVKGEIRFDAYKVQSSTLKIVGNKSAINDLSCSQGMLNYELKTLPADKFIVTV
jgi:hypothetical protein